MSFYNMIPFNNERSMFSSKYFFKLIARILSMFLVPFVPRLFEDSSWASFGKALKLYHLKACAYLTVSV